jgi:predicted GNAT family N-acyltransferase
MIETHYNIQIGPWSILGSEALALRVLVFVQEQGVPATMEYDEFDPMAEHAVVRNEAQEVVATGRLLSDGRIGRVAVRRDLRGEGLGKRVMQALIDHAQRHGVAGLHLHARCDASDFYRQFGFEESGQAFLEVGIRHILMVRPDSLAP